MHTVNKFLRALHAALWMTLARMRGEYLHTVFDGADDEGDVTAYHLYRYRGRLWHIPNLHDKP